MEIQHGLPGVLFTGKYCSLSRCAMKRSRSLVRSVRCAGFRQCGIQEIVLREAK